MDLLDSILNSMDKPPAPTEAQRKVIKKQKEVFEQKQRHEKNQMDKFRKRIEEKIENFKKSNEASLIFEPMEKNFRATIYDVAEIAGLQALSFGDDGIDRYTVVYSRDKGPSADEITVRRAGDMWNEEVAQEMKQSRKEQERYAAEIEASESSTKRGKKRESDLTGVHYKQKYAHLIGQDAAIDAAHKTNTNKSYGQVPSENKKDQRSIEQTMADIQAKKRRKNEVNQENVE